MDVNDFKIMWPKFYQMISRATKLIAIEEVKRKVHILCALTGHENVVHFHNAFEDNDYVYIIMELCECGELLDLILAEKDNRCCEIDAAKKLYKKC